ncbi:MAG: tRNA glutamyl-Q(34) synthetase GluQRS [Rubellimicrobium sp.]|nr:tRNA glutamyl-Q(34) synthetase GluQRS [Rubellimicrobium sp.]
MITRFAPSPTGPLHLGHACSAILAHDMARAAGGRFLLRFEDIDRQRCRPEWETAALDDLAWLGLRWDAPPLRQSSRLPAHRAALARLWDEGLLYPCTCTRRDIAEALAAPQETRPPRVPSGSPAPRPEAVQAAATGPDGPVYPGTCRTRPRPAHMPDDAHLRLDMGAALERIAGRPLSFTETGPGHAGTVTTTPAQYRRDIGDIVLARRDFGTSYHLAVTIDDAAQGITHVVRGEDLFTSTRVHVLLQVILGLPVPDYHHHRLIRDEQGRRLAKRDDARALSRYRDDGATPEDIRRMAGLDLG